MVERLEEIKAFSALLHELVEKVRVLEYEKEARLLASATVSLFDSGDTAWLLAATALVFLMTIPGTTAQYNFSKAQPYFRIFDHRLPLSMT